MYSFILVSTYPFKYVIHYVIKNNKIIMHNYRSGKLTTAADMKGREFKGVGSESDDIESVPSAISTIPGSGFAHHIPSSTPTHQAVRDVY